MVQEELHSFAAVHSYKQPAIAITTVEPINDVAIKEKKLDCY